MTVEKFFQLFMDELRINNNLRESYNILDSEKKHLFRKNYFVRRLEYISEHLGDTSNLIWDLGCGYGTTAIFLALNGYRVHGSTLEFYFQEIEKRISYWSQYGNINDFTFSYENLFDTPDIISRYDRIVVQDTLHHLEPINEAIHQIAIALKVNGKIIVIEENGDNLLKRANLFYRRGNKRIKKMYDERLKKDILIGNENVRSLNDWAKIFKNEGLLLQDVQYIRFYPPAKWKIDSYEKIVKQEDALWGKNKFIRDYLYWGVNFTAIRS